jgi:hypothetical protein
MIHDIPLGIPLCPYTPVTAQIEHPMSSTCANAFLLSPSIVVNERQPPIDKILPCKQLELGYSSSPTTIVQYKSVKMITRDTSMHSSNSYISSSSYFVKVILFLLAAICLATASSYSTIMYDVDGLSRNLSFNTLHGALAHIIVALLLMSNDGPRAHSLGWKMLLREVNNWDWFRTLAVP